MLRWKPALILVTKCRFSKPFRLTQVSPAHWQKNSIFIIQISPHEDINQDYRFADGSFNDFRGLPEGSKL